jgi:hypothetical protein
MRDLTWEMLVEARTLLRKLVSINEQAVGSVSPKGRSLLSCAKRCVEKPLPLERVCECPVSKETTKRKQKG